MEYQAARALKKRVQADLMSRPGVHGVTLMNRLTVGEGVDEWFLGVNVVKKLSPELVPEEHLLPTEVEGLPVRVIEHPRALRVVGVEPNATNDVDANEKTYRPLVGGCQVQIKNEAYSQTGTAGCIVRDLLAPFTLGIVSNQHVLNARGHVLYQPERGPFGGGWAGEVARTALSDTVDGAVAHLDDPPSQATIIDIGNVTGTHELTEEDVKRNDGYVIYKYGRTTGKTYAYLQSIDEQVDRGDRIFDDQIKVANTTDEFFNHGDSGSVLVNDKNEVVGLLWGGTEDLHYGYASPIRNVMDQLSIDVLVTNDTAAPQEPRDADTIGDQARSDLSASGAGHEVLTMFDRHLPELRQLIHHHPDVVATWRSMDGDAFLLAFGDFVNQRTADFGPLPSGQPISSALEDLAASLMANGSAELQSDLLIGLTIVRRGASMTWDQVVTGLLGGERLDATLQVAPSA